MNGAPQRLQTVPPPTRRRDRRPAASCRISIRCRASRSASRATSCASSSAAAASAPRSASPSATKNPAARAPGSATAASAPRTAPTPSSSACKRRACFDPTLNFLGTNDHPGDYRSSGCTACHVIYANDRSPVHSGPYASLRQSRHCVSARSDDPEERAGPSDRPPLRTGNAIPTSQCIVCHIHPGTNVMNSYLGYHVVGRGDRRRADVSGHSRSIRPPRSNSCNRRCRTPTKRPATACGRIRSSWRT